TIVFDQLLIQQASEYRLQSALRFNPKTRTEIGTLTPGYGLLPVSINPVFSSNPNIKFIFCTAWPAAPLTRLSSAVKTTSCRPRAAKPTSQKLVVLTQLISGEPSTRRTKNESR